MPLSQWYNGGMDNHEQETKITIRIPTGIAEQMRQLAKQHDRSLNGEIVRALREYIEQNKDKK
jgi:hypothetical protein